jgi:PAS domain S-box-containing protein
MHADPSSAGANRYQELSDTVINSLPGIFYLFNTEGKYIRWNKNFETVSGYSGEELAHKHPLDFFDAEEKKVIADRISEVFTTGRSEVEATFITRDGRRVPYYFNGIAIEFENQLCLIGMGIDITQRVTAEEALKEKNTELKRLSAYLQKVREEERKYMAREVHDELGQLATALKIDLDWLTLRMPATEAVMRNRLTHAGKTVDVLINSIRKMAYSLRPSILDDFGLNEALKWYCSDFRRLNGGECLFSGKMDDSGLDMHTKTELFRIAQESLTNVMRHAGATRVTVSTYDADSAHHIMITDNGRGFDATQPVHTLGLIGLRERVVSISGQLDIQSRAGEGTVITVSIPR